MANRLFGEAELDLGEGQSYTLRFDFNSLAEAEDAADMGIEEMLESVNSGSPRLRVAKALLWGALRHHHPDITLDEAGDLLSQDTEKVSGAMGRGLQEMAIRKQGANPPKGTVASKRPSPGTGTSSSKPGRKRG